MRRVHRRRNRSLVLALYLNAGLLAAVVLVLLTRGSGVGSTAHAAPPMVQPIAGGGGIFLMPAQFSMNTWGCYVMDIDQQTLCAYQYFPGQNQLRLTAARHFRYDRMLHNFNTYPSPQEVEQLVEVQKNPLRGKPGEPGRIEVIQPEKKDDAPDPGAPDLVPGPVPPGAPGPAPENSRPE